ncbi:MAG: YHS domain-containing (seleno)protein [Burkholderiales bacterium]
MTHPIPRCVQIAFLAAACATASLAGAGEYFEKDGVAIRGYDPVAYFEDGKATKGNKEYRFEHKGSSFLFASKANRDAFAAAPEKFAPQYGGFCAFGMAGGYKAAVDPAAFSVVNGKLYLNYNRDVQTQWIADVPSFVAKADRNWPAISLQTKVFE